MGISRAILYEFDFFNHIAQALSSKYGSNFILHFMDANNIVFSCSDISDKVIRINKEWYNYTDSNQFHRLNCYIGDAWTSGTTITNSVRFSGNGRTTSSVGGSFRHISSQLILGDAFMLLYFTAAKPMIIFVGKLTNGKFIVAGFNNESSGTYNAPCKCIRTDQPTIDGRFPTFHEEARIGKSFVAKPSHVAFGNDVELNTDGSLAYIPELYNIACREDFGYNEHYWMIQRNTWYTASSGAHFQTPLAVFY